MVSKNYYFVLGVQPNTSAEDIKKAFRALALRWHPDRHPAAAKVFAQRKFIEIAEAYQILGNEVCRHQYDALYTPRRSRSPAAHATEKTRRRMSQWQAMAAQRAVQMARASFGRFSEAVDLVSQRVSKGVFDFLEFFADKDPYACEIESCRDQIRKDPRDADQYYGLGFLHYKRGDFKKAAENYKRALLLNYDDADAFFGLGVVRHQMGDEPRAVNCFERVIELRRDDAEAHFRLGLIYLRKKCYEGLIRCIMDLNRLNRQDLAAKLTRDKFYMGRRRLIPALQTVVES